MYEFYNGGGYFPYTPACLRNGHYTESDSASSGQTVTPKVTGTPDVAPPYLCIDGKLYMGREYYGSRGGF